MLPNLARLTIGSLSTVEGGEGGEGEEEEEEDSKPSLRWKPVPMHFKIPHGVYLHEAACVAVDSQDNVYCFNRGNVPLIVFNRAGDMINVEDKHWKGTANLYDGYDPNEGAKGTLRWKQSEFVKPHGITLDDEDNLWLVDVGANTVTKSTKDGNRKLMLLPNSVAVVGDANIRHLLGKVHDPAPNQSGKPFNRPCNVAVQARQGGSAFVCDGYGNSRVHAFDRTNGAHLHSWGTSGTWDGEFNIPHDILVTKSTVGMERDEVLVADRENHRVQFFTTSGVYLRQWHVHRPCGIALKDSMLFACQLAAAHAAQRTGGPTHLAQWTKNIGNCVTVHDPETGKRTGRIGPPGADDSSLGLLEPHGVAVDSEWSVYTASVSFHREGKFRTPVPYIMATLKKWLRVETDGQPESSAS
jgi:hypothetical protein